MSVQESRKAITSHINNEHINFGWRHSFEAPGRKCHEDPDRGRNATAAMKQSNSNDVMLSSMGNYLTK